MSFWTTSEGQQVVASSRAEMGGDDLPPIPNNTQLMAMPTEAAWDENPNTGERLIKLRWDVIDGEYKKRVIFQKIRVADSDPKKADKAKRMLAAIDTNAGGQLMQIQAEPTDMQLAKALCNKPMRITVRIWEMDNSETGEKMTGNWVNTVESSTAPAKKPEPVGGVPSGDVDKDIGF